MEYYSILKEGKFVCAVNFLDAAFSIAWAGSHNNVVYQVSESDGNVIGSFLNGASTNGFNLGWKWIEKFHPEMVYNDPRHYPKS